MFVKLLSVVLLLSVCKAQDKDSVGVRIAFKIYDECLRNDGGFTPCLKKKAVTFFDRVLKLDTIPLADGVNVIKSADVQLPLITSENDLERSLPRNLEARDQQLNEMLIDRIAAFFSSRTVKLSFPSFTSQELSRSVEEGRGKMKKMMGMMMAGFAMKMAAMVPIAIAGLFLLAGKALITAKIALLLAGIIGLKKLLSQKGGGGHESHSSGWSSGGGGSGGWDRRSFEDEESAQNLAYRGYNTVQH
ncbi:uncharacterized protein LOC123291199 [Chrysoperla carnea]|uniref:uncharacterized protein LOC123291199 n=1 Tax=Chrysoperla carnea TaxID=189513 RepID=UPI001D098405|nr:uncharacterized protein LOC123291199 [Chrysoperla carnea]